MRINREEFLHCLESVEPGISMNLEQSACVVFRGGRAWTYNEDVSCSAPSELDKGVNIAVKHSTLTAALRKFVEEDLDVTIGESLAIRGKSRTVEMFLEREISLPLDSVEKLSNWSKLNKSFPEAVNMVQHCANKKEGSDFRTSCLHITPEWVESCDGKQLCRWVLKTGIKEPILVRRSAIKHIVSLGLSEYGETISWIHFRNASELMFSCRRYANTEYPDLKKALKVEGSKMTLPKGLIDAADCAQIFSSENDIDHILIQLKPGRIRIVGEGVSGKSREPRKVDYAGKSLQFLISPTILADLAKRHSSCIISSDRLLVDGGQYRFVACLSAPDAVSKEA